MYKLTKIELFDREVLSKYNVYNSVFLTLPFDEVNDTGSLLPLLSKFCQSGLDEHNTPEEIIEAFSNKYLDKPSESELVSLLFRFVQYIERQVVLFDAVEDAAFPTINNLDGQGSLREVKETAASKAQMDKLRTFLKEFKVRTVLTAHPTQFYPGAVLGIITDLIEAIKTDDLYIIKQLLSQLGKTPFIKKIKPTPYDEAVSLIWYLENVFYQSSGEIVSYIRNVIFKDEHLDNSIINLGFWPGGDRDGNPFVTTEITMQIADRLRTSILKCYYRDIRKLKRKLTFDHTQDIIVEIESKIYRSVYYSDGELFITTDELIAQLSELRDIVSKNHQSLYLDDIEDLIGKVELFGFYFATLDIRQNSKIHNTVFTDIVNQITQMDESIFPSNYFSLPYSERLRFASNAKASLNIEQFSDPTTIQTLESILAMQKIQQLNGEQGANRYIISNNENSLQVMETFAMIRILGWENPSVDIIPLLEVIDDLRNASTIMEELFSNDAYSRHLKNRGNKQTVMLGFSDGTKDGGYLMANWSIYKAKEDISAVAVKYGIKVIFFDGRGGPPARGGGKTHKFYASLGSEIENHEIQLTVQGQTISSNFGTMESCRFNLENLLSAGITNGVFERHRGDFTLDEKHLLDELSQISFDEYSKFKAHEKFIPYLEQMSTLKYYAMTNIGSRPSKRSNSDKLNFADLRAIPFVGSWSQLKQNVPGFFGLGSALGKFEAADKWESVQSLYDNSLFFRTLLENSMMSLSKSNFALTAYMKNDPEFGSFWEIIHNEFLLTKRLLLKISRQKELMENYPDGKASIEVREKIVLPLLVIQQFALMKINKLSKQKNTEELVAVYEKLVTRSLFGNINASRNSA